MAENPIDNNTFYAGDGKPYDKIIANLVLLEKQFEETIKKANLLAKELKSTGVPNDAAAIKEQVALMKELEKEQKKLIELEKQRTEAERDLAIARKAKIEQDKIDKENRKQLNTEYQKESKRLNDLRKEYKDLALAEKENTKEAKELLRQITALDNKLKQVDATVGQHQRNVGNYTSAWDKAKNVIGKMTGVFAAVSGSLWVVNKAIESSGSLTDKWNSITAQTKAGWEVFVQSLASWDWSGFTTRFANSINQASIYADKLDDIQEKMQVVSTQEKANRLEIVKLKQDLSNVNLTYDQREKIAKRIIKLEDEGSEKSLDLIKQQRDNTIALVASQTGATKKYVELFFTRLRTDEKYLKSIEAISNEFEKLNGRGFTFGEKMDIVSKKVGKSQAEIFRLNEALNGLSDEQKNELISNINAVFDKQIEVQQNKNSVYRRLNTLLAKDEKATQKDITDNLEEELKKREKLEEFLYDKRKESNRLILEQMDKEAEEKTRKREQEQKEEEDFWENYSDTTASPVNAAISKNTDFAKEQAKRERDERIKAKQEESAKILDETKVYADSAIDILDTVNNFQTAAMNRELQEAGDNEAKKDEIRKKYAKKEQQLAISKALINGALAVGTAAINAWPMPAILMMSIAAAKAASEVAVIKSVKFAKGGSWVEGGRLHSQGGNRYGDKELEKGEAVGVLSRKATKKHGKEFVSIVDAMNSDRTSLLVPDITLKDDNFKEVKKLVEINKMLLNEHKSLNSHLKNQIRQLAPGVYVDGKGNRINIV